MALKAFRCTSLYYEGHNINRAIQILYFNGFLKQLTQGPIMKKTEHNFMKRHTKVKDYVDVMWDC